MRIFLSVLMFFVVGLLCVAVQAQPQILWNKTFGGPGSDWAGCIIQGWRDYLVVGGTDYFDTFREDIYVLKIGADGNLIWNRTYSRSTSDSANRVVEAEDQSYLIAGVTWGGSPYSDHDKGNESVYDVYVLKIGDNGNKLWDKAYVRKYQQDDICIASSGDGGFILAASEYPSDIYEHGDWRIVYVFKIDRDGNLIWERTCRGEIDGGENYTQVLDLIGTGDGGFLLAGSCHGKDPKGDLYLLKIDGDGRKIWEKIYGGNHSDWASCIVSTGEDGFLVAGSTCSFGSDDDLSSVCDTYVLEIDSLGNKAWERVYPQAGRGRATSMVQTWEDTYCLEGHMVFLT